MTPELLSAHGIAALILTLGVGLLLGMVGGGGSIVVVPILVYVLGLPAAAAIALSLPIVGVTALVGAIAKAPRGEVHGRALLLFGVAGAVGALLGAQLTRLVPQPILLLMFAALLLGVGVKMLRGSAADELLCDNECRTGRCVVAGWGVGVLTGFLGVGGGFLLVPALRRFTHQNMKLAVGTSLGIIALNSAAGFLGHLGQVTNLLPLAVAVIAAALVGLFAGLKLAGRVPARALEKTFAGVALSVAAYLAFVNLPQAAKLIVNYF
jgi:uncharacterized membrane protein YfcA